MNETLEERQAATERLLRDTCTEWGITLAGDGSVQELDAERLLGLSSHTLKKQRENGICRLPRRRVSNRWRYRLSDIAALLEREYENE